jgi:hypothetical protein
MPEFAKRREREMAVRPTGLDRRARIERGDA